MPIPEFEFTHPLGHRDVNHYLQNPPSEEIWRDYLNEMPFEIRTYLKETVKAYLDDYLTHKAENVHIGKNAACAVFNASVQSIPDTTLTPLVFTAELFDTDAMFDVSTDNSKLICKTAGTYLIKGQVLFSPNVTGIRVLNLSQNGESISQMSIAATPSGTSDLEVVTIRKLVVNEYIQLRAKQTSGGALSTFVYGALNTQFSMVRIG